jgi:hypothetical protein
MKSISNRAGHSNSYTDPAEIDALKRRLTIHRRSLYVLEERRAKYGDLDVPLHIIHEIAEEKENIAQIEARLEELERGTPVPHHIDGKTQVMESGDERGVAVDEAMEKPAPSLGYFFAALLALDLILVFVLGWHLFGDQPLLLSYLEVVTGILGIGLEIALLTVAIQRKWSITEILRWLGTSKPWQATILIVTVDLLVVVLWPQVIEVISSVEEPLPPPAQFSYQVWVQAGDTGECIQDAVVTIEVEGQAPLDGIADSNGVARIFISSVRAGQPGFLIVEAKGYKRYTQNIDVTMDALPDVVLLERLAAVTLTPTVTPIETRMDTTFDYQVRVQAKDTGEYIQGAVVTIEVEGQAPLDGITDSNGLARIIVSSSCVGKPGRLIVEAAGYKRYMQNIDLTIGTLPDVVQLEPVP